MYDGNPPVKASKGSIIWVTANYRLGGFGFLAGSTVEKEGVPNAGFWDQRAAMEWIQKYISLVGGDPNEVSVWGESAGGGSVLYHLVAFGGTQPALFKRAVIQSPGSSVQYNRTGQLEKQYQSFATLAGCKSQGLACLRSKDSKALKKASDQIILSSGTGQYGFGPAVDGNFSRQLPGLELAQGWSSKSL
jgi:carboxylesterase type B